MNIFAREPWKSRGRFFLGPLVGSLSVMMMFGDGRALRFLGLWLLLFIVFGAFSAWMASLSASKEARAADFFFVLLCLPVFFIISHLLDFPPNVCVGILSAI